MHERGASRATVRQKKEASILINTGEGVQSKSRLDLYQFLSRGLDLKTLGSAITHDSLEAVDEAKVLLLTIFLEATEFCRLDVIRFAILTFDRLIDFLPMDRNIVRGFDTKPHFITTNVHNRDDNVIADHDAFVSMSREHKHWRLLFFVTVASSATGMDWNSGLGVSNTHMLCTPRANVSTD
jgi:hypothetical protein